MELSLMMPTHGLLYRDEHDAYLPRPDRHVDVMEVGRLAERLDFHSVWFSDHVCMTRSSDSGHPANWSGKRAYPSDAYMLDALVSIGAVAAVTTKLRFAPSVLISPYRHPLSDARQFMTADVISGGRLIVGVGAGWMREEFDALGLDFDSRGRVMQECVEIYLKCFADGYVDHDGEFFKFHDVSMDPKPIQQPPPIIYGAASRAGARRVAATGNGMYLLFLDPYPDIRRNDDLMQSLEREAAKVGRPYDDFEFSTMASALPTDANDPMAKASKRRLLTGTPEQMLEDLQAFADAGYSRCVLHLEVRSGAYAEYLELIERVGTQVLPEARNIPVRVPAI